MAISSIEWTDKVWNPVTGCTKVSAGCANCYAETFAHRGMGPWKGRKFEDVRCHEDRLLQPLKWKKPSKIFVNSMSDLFHDDVPTAFIDKVFEVMMNCPRHIFQVLTKRPQRMMEMLCGSGQSGELWKNVWLGVSVENQKAAAERIPLLFQTPVAVRFLSVEPMLEKIDIHDWLKPLPSDNPPRHHIHWVICGGESGPKARPFNIEWAQNLRDQCKAAMVPFFMKQMGGKPFRQEEEVVNGHNLIGIFPPIKFKDRKGGDMAEWPEDLRIREFPKRG